jgi:hypothetical protein
VGGGRAPRILLRAEGLAVAIAAIVLYFDEYLGEIPDPAIDRVE